MLCPYCHSKNNSQVIATRKYDTCVIRIRKCADCDMVWHTEEILHRAYGINEGQPKPCVKAQH